MPAAQLEVAQPRRVAPTDERQLSRAQHRAVIASGAADGDPIRSSHLLWREAKDRQVPIPNICAESLVASLPCFYLFCESGRIGFGNKRAPSGRAAM